MEKGGWGLTLKEKSAFGNSSLTPSWLNPIKSSGGGGGVSMFPVNLNGREAAALNEVDFFSDKKPPPAAVVVKKEMGLNNEHNTNTRPDLNVNTGLELVIANGGRDNQSTIDDAVEERRRANKNEVAVLQVELERMNDENQRLKGMLSEATNSYGALQMHLLALVQQQQQHHQISTTYQVVDGKSEEKRNVAATQFLDLAGRCGGAAAAGGDEALSHNNNCRTLSSGERTDSESSPSNNIESAETSSCRPNKLPKLNPVDNEQAAASADVAATMRKARVSVRARSEATMISDGCQWRKYGQKMAKGNPWPRAYYRCTMAIGCPVRKQVQRCVDDRTILNTTYEGAHNHPLPPAAMAMAATTSSAANTLLSGAMSSADVMMMNPNFLGRSIFPCSSSIATISASAPFPTITLDLTQQAPNSLPNYAKPPTNTYFPFSHAPQNLHNYVSVPQVFGQAGLYNQSKFSGLQVSNNNIPQHPSFGHETLSTAATAAITADPNFTAALAAAISSMINGSQPNTSSGTTTNSNNSSFPAK